MKTIIKTTGWIFIIFILINLWYESGYQKTTDKDYQINIPEPVPYMDTTDWNKYLIKKDTTKYKTKWVTVDK